MSYSGRMQQNHYYSVFFAPRGRDRMYELGMQIAQMYLSPFDKLIGIIGEAGSGKSMLIKGMFPGLELTNDDNGINMRPLPIMDQSQDGEKAGGPADPPAASMGVQEQDQLTDSLCSQ